METKNKNVLQLIVTVAGVFVSTLGLIYFNNHCLMSFPLGVRMIFKIISQWFLFLVPGFIMILSKEKIKDLGFTSHSLKKQIIIGLAIAMVMSALLTIFPILLGLRNVLSNIHYTRAWQFAYQFVYAILGVALVEELIFRGYIFQKLLEIKSNRWFAIILSSILFGFFHVFNGGIIQVVVTAIIGIVFCICREKIRDCTILSLIIAHGTYDALIVLWVGIL